MIENLFIGLFFMALGVVMYFLSTEKDKFVLVCSLISFLCGVAVIARLTMW